MRDYISEMDVIIGTSVPRDGDWVSRLIAAGIAERLSREDPDLLAGWLRAYAIPVLSRRISEHARSARGSAMTRARASAFGEAIEENSRGNPQPLMSFAAWYVVDAGNTHRKVGDMTGADHMFVATRHGKQARAELMEEAFHRAVAGRVGNRTTAEVFTEEQYAAMYREITSA